MHGDRSLSLRSCRSRRVPKWIELHSRRLTVIEVEQPAEPMAPLNPTVRVCGLGAGDQVVPASLMTPFQVVMPHVFRDRSPQMPFPQRQDSIEVLAPDRKHEPLRKRVEVRAARRKPVNDQPNAPVIDHHDRGRARGSESSVDSAGSSPLPALPATPSRSGGIVTRRAEAQQRRRAAP
jgi:hypothetical protein